HHQRDSSPECAISLVEIRETAEINAKQVRHSDPAADRQYSSWQRYPKSLLHVRREIVQRFYRQDCEDNRQCPVDIWPRPNPQLRQVQSARKPLAKSGTHDHHAECNQEQKPNQEGETDCERSRLPEWTGFLDIVSDVERFN